MTRSHRNARGVTLIELMVALAIGMLLVLGLVEVFAASRVAYQLSEGLSRVQENGRFGMDYLLRDLRMVGHFGCVNDQARFLPENTAGSRNGLISTFVSQANRNANPELYTTAPFALRFDVSLQGYDANGTSPGNTRTLLANPVVSGSAAAWTPALPNLPDGTNLAARAIAGSDVVVLRHFAPTGAQVTGFAAGNPATIDVSVPAFGNLTEGTTNPGLFGISDCATAAVFRASTANSGTGRITVGTDALNLSALDGENGSNQFAVGQAMVFRAESIIYYVGIGASGEPALFRMRVNIAPGAALDAAAVQAEELVEGVESLQLLYGVDEELAAAQTPHGYMNASTPATTTTPWDRVGLVQVGLVARSPNPAAATQRATGTAGINSLSALNVAITPPADSRYRTVYESSTAMRNRLFGN